jgi:hypothetical protein
MRWPNWSISVGRGDFLPILIGSMMLLMSVPAVVMLLVHPDRNAGAIVVPLLVVLGGGIIIGAGFVVFGIQICAPPGSLAYRLSRGRFFSW